MYDLIWNAPAALGWPWYTKLALMALLCLTLWVLWGVIVVGKNLMASMVLRTILSLPMRLTGLWLTVTQGRLGLGLGTAHWALAREVREAGLLTPGRLPLGTWHGQTLVEPGGGHVMVMGPPRSRKSWGVIMPMLRTWPGSVVCSDLRGELHAQTADARAAIGAVYRFAPVDEDSCSLNILDSVRWDTDQAHGDVLRIVTHLLLPQREQLGQASPFTKAAIPLLAGIVCHCAAQGDGSFPGVYEWMTDPSRPVDAKVKELLDSPQVEVARAGRRVLDQSDRLRASTWNAALENMTIFGDPRVARHTRHTDFAWSALLDGLEPMSLFLCMPFRDIDRLGAFIGAVCEALLSVLGSPVVTPRHTTLLLLDELANLGTLTELERGMSTLQGSGVQVVMVWQNLPQALTMYGPHSPILASVATKVFYTPVDLATATWVSDMLGESTTWTTGLSASTSDSHSRSTGFSASLSPSSIGLGASMSSTTGTSDGGGVSLSQTRRRLLTADEVLRLPADAAVVLVQGTAPVYAHKFPGPGQAVRRGAFLRLPRRWVLTTAVLGMIAVAFWPLVTQHARHRQLVREVHNNPLQPWEHDTGPASPTLAMRRAAGAPMSLPDTVAAMRQEQDRQRWQQTEADILRRRKPQKQLEDEMVREVKDRLGPRIPPYRGSWQIRHLNSLAPINALTASAMVTPVIADHGPQTLVYLQRAYPALYAAYLPLAKAQRTSPRWPITAEPGWFPTQDACVAAITTDYLAPRLALGAQKHAADPLTFVRYQWQAGVLVVNEGRTVPESADGGKSWRTVYEWWCEDRPYAAPGLQPRAPVRVPQEDGCADQCR